MVATPANDLNISAAGLVKFDGTATFSGVTVTQHDVLVGAASNGITSVAPSATSGIPLVSNGASADPSFTTAVVAGGGTGVATLTGLALGSGTSAFTGVTYTAQTSFTPVLKFGGATTGITYSVQTGTYQRIGNMLFFGVEIILSSKGSATGTATITGLPVAAATVDIENPMITVSLTLTATNLYAYYQIPIGQTTIGLYQNTIAGGQSVLTDTNFSASSQIFCTGVYFV